MSVSLPLAASPDSMFLSERASTKAHISVHVHVHVLLRVILKKTRLFK